VLKVVGSGIPENELKRFEKEAGILKRLKEEAKTSTNYVVDVISRFNYDQNCCILTEFFDVSGAALFFLIFDTI
jgi:hypothetical protein